MQFLTLPTLALSAMIGVASASLDSTACGGIGACLGASNCVYFNGYDCGTEGSISTQIAAGAQNTLLSGLSGGAVTATADEFPTSCDTSNPSADSVLVKYTFDTDAIMYGFIDYNCGEVDTAFDDCYNFDWNHSTVTYCKVIKNGTTCTPIGDTLGTC